MANPETAERTKVVDVVERLGNCFELVPLDPHFHEISVGLYAKDNVFTVWTYNQTLGVEVRIEKIRDQLVSLGGLEPVAGRTDQVRFSCGETHRRPLKFLTMQAVERDPDYKLPESGIKDLRSPLMLNVSGREQDGRWVYSVTGEGEAPNAAARLRAIASGMVRYGEMEKVDEVVAFTCGQRHDKLAMIVLPYARNVSGVETMLDEAALRGQMTTSTLGFTPPT